MKIKQMIRAFIFLLVCFLVGCSALDNLAAPTCTHIPTDSCVEGMCVAGVCTYKCEANEECESGCCKEVDVTPSYFACAPKKECGR